MRSLLIAFISFSSLLSMKAGAQNLPSEITNSFHSSFPMVGNIHWSTAGHLYRAEFLQGPETKYAYFDQNGELVLTGHFISFSLLPKRLQNDLVRLFPMQDHIEVFEVNYDNNVDYFATIFEKGRTTIMKSTQLSKWRKFLKS